MDGLASFLDATLGVALATEMTILVGFVIVLNMKRLVFAALHRT